MPAKIIELIDVQNQRGQEVLNVYHFVDPDGVGDEATLVSDYIDDVIPLLINIQSSELTHVAIRHRQVYPTALLLQTTPISPAVAGTNTAGDTLPDFYAFSVKNSVGATVVLAGGFTGHIKRSGIRIGGASENQVTDGVPTSSTITTAATFLAELQNPGTDAFLLCVASFLNGARVRQTTVQSYALITGFSDVASSTQNSRKQLRGRNS